MNELSALSPFFFFLRANQTMLFCYFTLTMRFVAINKGHRGKDRFNDVRRECLASDFLETMLDTFVGILKTKKIFF